MQHALKCISREQSTVMFPFSFFAGGKELILVPRISRVQEEATEHFGGPGVLTRRGNWNAIPCLRTCLQKPRDLPSAATGEKGRAVLGESGIWVAKSLLPMF